MGFESTKRGAVSGHSKIARSYHRPGCEGRAVRRRRGG